MASVSTLSFLKLRFYAKSRHFNKKFHFGHKISYLKSRLFVKLRFVKSRLYCIRVALKLAPSMGNCDSVGNWDVVGDCGHHLGHDKGGDSDASLAAGRNRPRNSKP